MHVYQLTVHCIWTCDFHIKSLIHFGNIGLAFAVENCSICHGIHIYRWCEQPQSFSCDVEIQQFAYIWRFLGTEFSSPNTWLIISTYCQNFTVPVANNEPSWFLSHDHQTVGRRDSECTAKTENKVGTSCVHLCAGKHILLQIVPEVDDCVHKVSATLLK